MDRKELYPGPFYTVKNSEFELAIYYKRTDQLVASSGLVIDPLYPHFICIDFRGITVEVALNKAERDVILASMINDWLKNGGGIKQQEEYADREDTQ